MYIHILNPRKIVDLLSKLEKALEIRSCSKDLDISKWGLLTLVLPYPPSYYLGFMYINSTLQK
jgi:hypothetical protein